MCPSRAAFAIRLGPTNPWLIIIAKETLVLRRAGFSPALWLLVPTFVLRIAPVWVTPLPSQLHPLLSGKCEHSPTTCTRCVHILNFGTTFSPDYLRRGVSMSVSCYAIFKGWLLLSQPPDCQRNSTTLSALNVDLGTLNRDLGCFLFDVRSLAPAV